VLRIAAKLAPNLEFLLHLGTHAAGGCAAGQGGGFGDVLARGLFAARQAVQQVAIVERTGMVREGRHHGITAADLFWELIEAHILEAVVAADLPLGQWFLRAAAGQQQ
jgi:hypothetical protein